jgi:P-type Ca2+ transporter type 2C
MENARSCYEDCSGSPASTLSSRLNYTWHALATQEVESKLESDLRDGLTQQEAERRLSLFGPNALPNALRRSRFAILLGQFKSLMVVLLAVATIIAFALGETIEGIAILVVILLNATIGALTEWKADQALSALRKQAVRIAQVIRDGVEKQIPAEELVPGDLVILEAGARVPADGRIVESARLQVEEAALTGESVPVSKSSELVPDEKAVLGDQRNMAFLGTTVTDGRGRILLTATGSQSEVGKIGSLIDEAISRSTPLEQKLAKLGRLLVFLVLVLCIVIVLVGWIRGIGNIWHLLEMGLSLAIAAVPEGLPAVTTMTLAIGMQRMARMRALVRRLPAVETLGSVSVICTDKTGTLTKNEMTACAFVMHDRCIDVTGQGYCTTGAFHHHEKSIKPESFENLSLALKIGVLCNDSKIERGVEGTVVLGDPTEAALVVAGEKAGINPVALRASHPRLREVPFDSDRKRMVTVHRMPDGRTLAMVKGAPGTILESSTAQQQDSVTEPMTPSHRKHWEAVNRDLASAAIRVLALAYRELPSDFSENDLDQELTLVGLVGMSDVLREEAKLAIQDCRNAGIRAVMITGDQPLTASEIARQLGIDAGIDGRRLQTIHGRDLHGLDADGWSSIVADAAVFARVSPEHKLKIVETLQSQGHVVAMTGDGVNDAPALKKADIGIAMGIKGTEVAKENADMVITDDDFATIVKAVEQGRIIYGNILRFLHYLLSCNLAEILTVFLAVIIGWPLPLVALQILWLNLVTDVFPAFALALEPSSPDAMKRPPRKVNEPLLTGGLMARIVWQGVLLASVTLIAFYIGLRMHGFDGSRQASTMAFMTLAFAQILHVFNARSQHRTLFGDRLFTNGWLWCAVAGCVALQVVAVYVPLLQTVLHTLPPSFAEWQVIIICSLMPIVVTELEKLVWRGLANEKP